jgi:hypothetical protein
MNGFALVVALFLLLNIVAGLLRVWRGPTAPHRRWRVLLAGGLLVFLLVAVSGFAAGGRFLELSPRWAGAAIMLVETARTASIALILIVLFDGTSPSHDGSHWRSRGAGRTLRPIRFLMRWS